MKRLTKIILGFAAVIFVTGIGLCVGGMVMGASPKELAAETVINPAGLGKESGAIQGFVKNVVLGDEDWDEEDWDEEDWDDEDWDDGDWDDGDWDDEDWDDEDWDDGDEAHHLVSPEEGSGSGRVYQVETPETLEIELQSDELILRRHSGDGIEIQVQGDDRNQVLVTSEGKKLSIESTDIQSGRRIIFSYPSSLHLKKFELNVDAGKVSLEEDLTLDKLEVYVGAGHFTAGGKITAEKVDFELGAGKISLNLLDTRKLVGECGLGSMEMTLAGSGKDYNCQLECGAGRIVLDKEEYSGLAREKEIRNSGASRTVHLECAMGNMEVMFENN